MSIDIRQATAGDGPAIAEMIQELAAAGDDVSPVTPAYAEDYLRAAHSQVLLAEEAGQPVGMLTYSVRPNLYHAGPSAMIEELVVRGGSRGRGVGSALLTEVVARLVEIGCTEASVTVMPDNEAAQRLYRRHGFVDEAVFLERHF
jgi:ribosomal protein S18 acetylase RimI-like enzyme